MCCSSGVCGSDVDPALSRFARDLEWLTAHGAKVSRATLSQEPGKFVENPAANRVLTEQGTAGLPLVIVDQAVRVTGRYPRREELAEWTGIHAAPSAQQTVLPIGGACTPGDGCC